MKDDYEQNPNKQHRNDGRPRHVPVRGFHFVRLKGGSSGKSHCQTGKFRTGGFKGLAHRRKGFADHIKGTEILGRQDPHDQQPA